MAQFKRCSKGGRCRKHQNGVAPLQPIAEFKNKHGTEFNNCQTCRTYQNRHTRMYRERNGLSKKRPPAIEEAASKEQSSDVARQMQLNRWLIEVLEDKPRPKAPTPERIRHYRAERIEE